MRAFFKFDIDPMGKARPRVAHGRAYMPKEYVQWKKAVGAIAKQQYSASGPYEGKFGIELRIVTKSGLMRPDLDNVLGAYLDALQDAHIISNDRNLIGIEETGVFKGPGPSTSIHLIMNEGRYV